MSKRVYPCYTAPLKIFNPPLSVIAIKSQCPVLISKNDVVYMCKYRPRYIATLACLQKYILVHNKKI